ncbi:MAG TPA: hypothetical protein VJV04_16410 [Nitrospiraceae bacterium]|nr:hypothetical protein [Nitrospiraceae bacterium]
MTRRIEPIDLMVAVGAFATIMGGYILFMAANGTLESAQPQLATIEPISAEIGPMAAMQWVQPALGQALVENDLLDRAILEDIKAAAKELNQATLMAQSLEGSTATSFNDLSASMMARDADHAARVQYILGRSIVVFTERGIQSGVLSPILIDEPYNQRMIALTDNRGARLESAYEATGQPVLGRAIVSATQEAVRFDERLQDRLGKAIVRIASLQEENQAKGEAQTQLALLTLASLHTEEMADRFENLAKAEASLQPVSTVLSEPRTWPDIPSSLLIAGSIGLIGVFFVGLMMPSVRPEESPSIREVPSEPVYRKTA